MFPGSAAHSDGLQAGQLPRSCVGLNGDSRSADELKPAEAEEAEALPLSPFTQPTDVKANPVISA